MHTPPAPVPNLEPPGKPAQVQQADNDLLQQLRRTTADVVRDAAAFADRHQEECYDVDEGLRDSAETSRRLDDATSRLSEEASQPAEVRPEEPRRSRPQRRR
jgi:hypothetical protein